MQTVQGVRLGMTRGELTSIMNAGFRLSLRDASKEVRDDKATVINFLGLSYFAAESYTCVSNRLRQDVDVIVAAVEQNGNLWGEIPEHVRADIEVVKKLVLVRPMLMQEVLWENGRCKEILESRKQHGFLMRMVDWLSDIWVGRQVHAVSELSEDKNFMLKLVSREGLALKWASQGLASDLEVVASAINQDGNAFEYASTELRGNRDIACSAIRKNGLVLRYAAEELKDDRDLVLLAVSEDPLALEHASERLRNDKEIVLKAVSRHAGAWKYASLELIELVRSRYDHESIVQILVEELRMETATGLRRGIENELGSPREGRQIRKV